MLPDILEIVNSSKKTALVDVFGGSGFLYYHVFSGYYWDIIFSVLLIYTVFFLYESYEKTYGKKNKIK